MRRFTLLAGCALALLSAAGCGDAPSPVLPDAAGRPSLLPLSVTISGPDDLDNGWTCTWTADVTGGTPPYTYQWGGNTGMVSTGPDDESYWTGYKAVYTWGSLYVTVTDADNRQVHDELIIEESWSQPANC